MRFPFLLTAKEYLLAVIIAALLTSAGRCSLQKSRTKVITDKENNLCWKMPADDKELKDTIEALRGEKVWNGKRWKEIRKY